MMLASGPVFAASFLVARCDAARPVGGRFSGSTWWCRCCCFRLRSSCGRCLAGPVALLLFAFLGAGGHCCMTRAFRVADISAVQSVKFLELLWAAMPGTSCWHTPAGWSGRRCGHPCSTLARAGVARSRLTRPV